MALETKIPVSGIKRLILQATRGCKEGKHGEKNVQLILDASPHSLADSSGVGSHPAHELSLTLEEPWGAQQHDETELPLFVLHSHLGRHQEMSIPKTM